MHILFILDYFAPYIGGIETLFDDVTKFCVNKGYTVTILTSCHDNRLAKLEKRNNIHIYRIWKNRFTIIRKALRFWITHRSLFQSIDHIHTSTFAAAIPAWILSKLYKKPCTITIHEIYHTLRYHLKWKKGIFYMRFEKILLQLPWKHIVTVSNYTKSMIQHIHHLSDQSISVIYNQIDTYFWDIHTVDKQAIQTLKEKYNLTHHNVGLFIGRLGYEKWLSYLIEAMNDIVNYDDTFKLVIIAPKTPHLYDSHIQWQIQITKHHINNNNLNKYIIWIDPVEDDETLKLWMTLADIGIVPSMSEWFCYTAVQMQAMWLPLIVSKVGALPEVLESHHTFIWYGKIKEISNAICDNLDKKKILHTNNGNSHIDYQAYCDIFLS